MTDRFSNCLITVAMPVYNAGVYLRTAVLSILNQTHLNWELLIIDDGSTDTSLESIDDIYDPRIKLLRDHCNKGLAARLNEAVDLARGQFLARMDGDDISYPDRFATQIALFRSDPQLDVVSVRAITISRMNEIVGILPSPLNHAEICAKPWRGFYFPHPTWMGRIEWFRRHRYRTLFRNPISIEDQELLLRTYRDSKFACVPEIQFAYRIQDRILLKKRLKTRLALFRVQTASFLTNGQYRFTLIAGVVFVLRILSDFGIFLSQLSGASSTGQSSSVLENPATQQWGQLKRRFSPDKL